MTLSNVKWILAKEVRDQLRDRRTLFMIAVLPILLYPLLGMSLLQVAQFVRKQATRVLVVGADNLTGSAPGSTLGSAAVDQVRSPSVGAPLGKCFFTLAAASRRAMSEYPGSLDAHARGGLNHFTGAFVVEHVQ